MPYIVTHWPHCPGCDDPSTAPHLAKPPLSRRAIAAQEDVGVLRNALLAADSDIGDPEWERHMASWRALPESGGTVGPLPDGTLIDVRHADLSELEDSARTTRSIVRDNTADIIAAYNARRTSDNV